MPDVSVTLPFLGGSVPVKLHQNPDGTYSLAINNVSLGSATVPDTTVMVGGGYPLKLFQSTDGSYSMAISGAGIGASYGPADLGLVAWAYDPFLCGASGSGQGTGRVNFFKMKLSGSVVVTNYVTLLSAAGSGLVASQNYFGLYDNNGNRLDATGTDAFFTQTASQILPLASGPLSLSMPYCFVAVLWNGASGPTFQRSPGSNQVGVINAAGASGSLPFFRCGFTQATGQTVLPATLPATGNGVTQGTSVWVGLS